MGGRRRDVSVYILPVAVLIALVPIVPGIIIASIVRGLSMARHLLEVTELHLSLQNATLLVLPLDRMYHF